MSAILYVYPGGYGLPTIDPKCLQLVFYLRLHPGHGIIIRAIKSCTSPRLPALQYGLRLITRYEAVVEFIERLCDPQVNVVLNHHTRTNMTDMSELNARLEWPLFLSYWGDEDNAEYFTNVYSTGKSPNARKKFVRALKAFNDDMIRMIVVDRPIEVRLRLGMVMLDKYLQYLSVIIQQYPFIFGDSPSSFDAYLCGYLAPILIYECPNPVIRRLLSRYGVLVSYARNFLTLYGGEETDIEVKEQDDFMLTPNVVFFIILIITMTIPAFVLYFTLDN